MNAKEYLQQYDNYFWQWETTEQVFSIPNGGTIGYLPFVAEIVDILAEQRLPTFGALLLAMVATNQSEQDNIGNIEKLMKSYLNRVSARPEADLNLIEETCEYLRTLQELPPRFTQGKMRLMLFQLLFTDCHYIATASLSEAVAHSLTASDLIVLDHPPVAMNHTILRDFRTISLIKRKYPDAESIIRAFSELPELPEIFEPTPAIKDAEAPRLPPSEQPLLEKLLSNLKTYQIAALAQYLWSGLNLVMPESDASRQPMGGVADLNNKGNFHQLLISEFANDTDVFLSRIANNEALYFEREKAPEANEKVQVVMVDVSLKNWGTPKLLAHAIALAIQQHPNAKNQRHQLFAVGDTWQEHSYDTVDKVIEALTILEPGLNASKGLEAYFEADDVPKNAEITLISSVDATAYPTVQKQLAKHREWFKWWIMLTSDAEISVYKNVRKKRKLVREIRVPLEQIWSQHQPKLPAQSADFPSAMTDFPILFFPPTSPKRMALFESEKWYLSKNGNVFLQKTKKSNEKGVELLVQTKKRGVSHFSVGRNGEGERVIILGKSDSKELTLWNVDQDTFQTQSFANWKPHSDDKATFEDGQFHFIGGGKHWVVSFEGSLQIQQETIFDKLIKDKIDAEFKQLNFPEFGNVLYNVHDVGINLSGNLIINKHQLVLNQHGIIKWEMADKKDRLPHVQASMRHTTTGLQLFTFPNGNTVTVHSEGMIELNADWEDSEEWTLILEDAGTSQLALVKYIKAHFKVGLKEAKTMVDSAPGSILVTDMKEAVDQHEKELIEIGAKVFVKQINQLTVFIPLTLERSIGMANSRLFSGNAFYLPDNSQQLTPSTDIFYEQFIDSFVHSIAEDAT